VILTVEHGRGVELASEPGVDELLNATEQLLAAVRSVPLELATPRQAQAHGIRAEIADQLSDYVIPRLRNIDAPILVVVGGSTGVGKSTLVNSLVGRNVSDSGVLRPTTRTPVLVHHPSDAHWFASDEVLPDLKRTGDDPAELYALRQVSSPNVPAGLALLDAPDVDSVDEGNRALAEQLLAAADLWLFVTSAARYADQVPWGYLRRAAERNASVAVVLDRASADSLDDVRGHLARMMTARGMSDSPLLTVCESEVDADGMIPFEEVGQIAVWLQELAADVVGRRTIVAATLSGAIRHDVFRSRDLADELEEQADVIEALIADVDQIHSRCAADAAEAVASGAALRGEAAVRWRTLLDDPRREARTPAAIQAAETSIGSALAALLTEQVDRAGEQVVAAWSARPAGRALLEANRDRANDHAVAAEQTAREWLQFAHRLMDETERTDRTSQPAELVPTALVVAALAGDGQERSTAASLLRSGLDEQTANQLIDRAGQELRSRIATSFDDQAERYRSMAPDPKAVRSAQRQLRKIANRADVVRLSTDIRRGTKESL